MFDRGKLVILIIFALGVAAAAFSWLYGVQGSNQALRLWGSETALLIRDAPQIELLVLDSVAPGDTSVLEIGGRGFQVASQRNISKVPGLLHARHALIQDASFTWEDPGSVDHLDWRFAFRFSDREKQCIVVFDSACRYAQLSENGRPVSIRPISDGLQAFISEQLERAGVNDA